MFLKRIFVTIGKSLFGRNAEMHEPDAEECVILKRLKELMEMTPTPPATPAEVADGGVGPRNPDSYRAVSIGLRST